LTSVVIRLNSKAYLDDSQIVVIHCYKFYTNREPRVEVKIRNVEYAESASLVTFQNREIQSIEEIGLITADVVKPMVAIEACKS
jgi:Endodeoxyribonuclease RusA